MLVIGNKPGREVQIHDFVDCRLLRDMFQILSRLVKNCLRKDPVMVLTLVKCPKRLKFQIWSRLVNNCLRNLCSTRSGGGNGSGIGRCWWARAWLNGLGVISYKYGLDS